MLYWKRGGAFIFIALTIACLGVSVWRFAEDFTVADRPPQFFDLRHNLGGLEDVTSNYFSEVSTHLDVSSTIIDAERGSLTALIWGGASIFTGRLCACMLFTGTEFDEGFAVIAHPELYFL